MNYRPLTSAEIERLKLQSNRSDDWSGVAVGEGFDAAFVVNSVFSGKVHIGSTGGMVCDGPVKRAAGIYSAHIDNCSIGDNVLISNIGSLISHYDIGDGCIIENTGEVVCTGESAFGNGVMVAAVNENGGRSIPIFDGMTAQTAYIMAMYRHRKKMLETMEGFVKRHCDSVRASIGTIGAGTVIRHCVSIQNTRIGSGATLSGVSLLSNGTVHSHPGSLSSVREGVVAHDFIIAPGAYVGEGVNLKSCFVGEGVKLDRGFAAEHSLFFACCDMALGEACSVFAGPYTVSHHRSTLLIAGLFSFFNAGSGANQSNHLYKSGPVHQGVTRRGCKFGSDAYVLLPARTGAFSIVMGRHYSNYDTDDFPFSYLVEEDGRSYLMPGANLRSCGTRRDELKWPKRDRRGEDRHDLICFELLNPAVVGKLADGIGIMEKMLARGEQEVYTFNRVRIKQPMLRRGITIYRSAVNIFLAGRLKQRTENVTVFNGITADDLVGDCGRWVDLAGLVVPQKGVEMLLDALESGEVSTLADMEAILKLMHDAYGVLSARWAVALAARVLGKGEEGLTAEETENIVAEGEKDAAALDAIIEDDFAKDFGVVMATGYGIDSADKETITSDFDAVRQ